MVATYKKINNVVVNNYDPTRTIMLRKAFVRDSNRRFGLLAVAVREAVQTKNVFGLGVQNNAKLSTPEQTQWIALSDKEKTDAFLRWIDIKYSETILYATSLYSSNNFVWTDKYALDAYKRGVQLARSEMKKLKYQIETKTIDAILSTNSHKRMISSVLSDTYNGYRSIASAMDAHFVKIINDGFINKISPKQMADRLVSVINGFNKTAVTNILGNFVPGKTRGQAHVETAITKAHHLASIQEYEDWDLSNVKVQAEFVSMKDNKVCSICATLDGQIYTISEIRTMIPVHVRCRCFAKPVKST